MKEYYVLYQVVGGDVFGRMGRLVCIVENKDVADDWCQKHDNFYYTIEQCELPSEI